MRWNRRWRRPLTYVAGALFLSVFTLALVEGFVALSSLLARSPLEGVENQITDLGFQTRTHNTFHGRVTTEDVVIIDIDDESIRRMGRPQMWPRAYDAFAIRYIASGKPKAIGVDYLYTEPDSLLPAYGGLLSMRGVPDPQFVMDALSTDEYLHEALIEADCVYLSFFDDDFRNDSILPDWSERNIRRFTLAGDRSIRPDTLHYPVGPIPYFAQVSKGAGGINMPSGIDGTVRYYPLAAVMPGQHQGICTANFPFFIYLDQHLPSDSLVLKAEQKNLIINDSLRLPVRSDGTFRINWLGREDKIRSIPFYKIMDEFIPAEYFENKYVFFGTSASGMQDLKTVPGTEEKIPGVEVHAIAFLNLMNGAFLSELNEWEMLPYFLLASLLLTMLFLVLKPMLGFLVATVLVFGEMISFSSWFMPEYNTIFPIVTLMLLTFFSYLNASLFTYFIRERRSRHLKNAFGTYLSQDVVEQIIHDPEALQLGGQKKVLSVLFSDIRGFTTYTEKLDPQQIVSMLNDYLSHMSDVIFKHRGTIDKFIGDAIMAIFGAPVPQEDHAARACRVSLDMVTALKEVNGVLVQKGFEPLAIGIGINTGEMTVGNIGSERRFDYTVIGDAVNLGSRLEGLTKYFGVEIIVSQSTKDACDANEFYFRELGSVKVKGKKEAVAIYHLVGSRTNDSAEEAWMELWSRAFEHLRRNEVMEALQLFMECRNVRNDESTTYYINRCNEALLTGATFELTIKMDSK